MVQQDGHGRALMPQGSSIKLGKVIAIHRGSNSVDLVFMDGVQARNVPVSQDWAGTNYGTVTMTAPSFNPEFLAQKGYPNDIYHSTRGNGLAHGKANTSKTSRDVYAVVAQFEGSASGSNGMVVLGFIYPQVSEMLFPGGPDSEFPDLALVRHPSDVQITIDHLGKVSIQHPAGAYITIGTDLARTDLEGKDVDKLYKLRHNKATPIISGGSVVPGPGTPRKVGIRIEDTEGSWIELDHEGNIKAFAPKNIEVEAGENITAIAGEAISAQAGTSITATAGTSITATAGTSITATAGTSATVTAGAAVTVTAGAAITLTAAGPITLTSPSLIALTAPSVIVTGTDGVFDEAKTGGEGRMRIE